MIQSNIAPARACADVTQLFQPLDLREVTIRNRVAMAPMTRSFCPNGVPDEAVVAYYRRRAEGGTGLIFTEAIATDHPAAIGDTGLGETDLPLIHTPESLAGWRGVVDAVHAAGGRVIPQFWHQGPNRLPGTGPFPDALAFSPSGTWGPRGRLTSLKADLISKLEMPMPTPSDAEISDVVEGFGRAARAAKLAGFDGVALHGAHGYLIDSFLWEETNLRKDRWGGSSAQRLVFATEIVKAVRREIGESLPIVFRFSQWKQQDFKAKLATTPQQLEALLGPLADAGVDMFDASVRYFNTPAFEGSDLSLAGWARKLTGKLSGAVGGIGVGKGMYDTMNQGTASVDNMDLVMKRYERGEFDLISVGRALINDADWTNKMRSGVPFEDFDADRLRVLV